MTLKNKTINLKVQIGKGNYSIYVTNAPPQKGTPFWGCLFVIWEDLNPSDGGAGEPSKSFR